MKDMNRIKNTPLATGGAGAAEDTTGVVPTGGSRCQREGFAGAALALGADVERDEEDCEEASS